MIMRLVYALKLLLRASKARKAFFLKKEARGEEHAVA